MATKPTSSTAEYIPDNPDLEDLREAAAVCKGCDLWKKGTQTVFGEGPRRADIMLVGEQPGDVEDEVGRPFVGPAGRILDRALEKAGLDRDQTYVTNAVKHFRWEETRGKRRIHKKPSFRQVSACLPWLEAEIAIVRPRVIIALGATAAQAILGRSFRLTNHRGEILTSPYGPRVTATVHPSSILRAPSDEERRLALRSFIHELSTVLTLLEPKHAAR